MSGNSAKRTAEVAGLSSGSDRVGRQLKRPALTRKDRAMVRLLSAHGLTREDIAKRISCSTSTVTNVVNKLTAAAMNDAGDDYDYVDDSFKAEFPPNHPDVEDKKIKFEDDVEEQEHLPAMMVRKDSSKMPEPKKPDNKTRKTISTPVEGKIVRRRSKRHPVATVVAPADQSRPIAGPSRQRPVLIDLEKEASGDDDIREDLEGPVVKFLAGLDHDLSSVHGALKKQDLGTTTKLFAIAGWPEDELHKMFREALPEITIAQRFILVKGLKKDAST